MHLLAHCLQHYRLRCCTKVNNMLVIATILIVILIVILVVILVNISVILSTREICAMMRASLFGSP